MRCWLAITIFVLAGAASAHTGTLRTTEYPAKAHEVAVLRILGSTDTEVFAPLVADFQKAAPTVRVVYQEDGAHELYQVFLDEVAKGQGPDLVISSAMDLQTKLVNDGYAATHVTPAAAAIPAWAQWRQQLYGFSFEPVVMVYNTKRLTADQVPRSHKALLQMLLDPQRPLDGRIGSYDVESSSVGYLLATQDARVGQMAGALFTALGHNHMATSDQTGSLLGRIERGELLLGYNLLGSYVRDRIAHGAPLAVIVPADYTLAISRTVFVTRTARYPALAGQFVDYLLSRMGQEALVRDTGTFPIRTDMANGPGDVVERRWGPVRPLVLGPGLLVYLDALKQKAFLDEWRGSIGK